ncbi:hypothetical protein IFM89_022020 [Coptis chinensis]|uniref:Uncharacterized protein n=1 Tax=Coptis chinensis TaxID=261450 RepID=A0A835I2A1_9MAGN|nr:hypothetical protein IFM89_022020 [Coptis chinensis]
MEVDFDNDELSKSLGPDKGSRTRGISSNKSKKQLQRHDDAMRLLWFLDKCFRFPTISLRPRGVLATPGQSITYRRGRGTYTGLSGCDDYILELFLPPGTTALSKHRYLRTRLGDNEGEQHYRRTSIAIRSSILRGSKRPFFETYRGGSFLRWGHVYVHGWKPRLCRTKSAQKMPVLKL